MPTFRTLSMCAAFFALALALPSGAEERTATLYRDTWGVPHIYADSLEGASFALGYAQAEDRLPDIYANIRLAIGTLAEVLGPSGAERDYVMRLVRNAERCEAYWKTAPTPVRALGDGFVRGVEAYAAAHPERKPAYAFELHGWHTLAVGRAMILNWPLETLMKEAANRTAAPPFGSNSFAVSPVRSADGSAILMTDPHLTWEGLAVFYEARLHAPEFDLCGFWLVGSPLPALGHSGYVSWACTTGGPDTSDVYMVKLNPENPLQYGYNDEWRDFEVKSIALSVRGEAPLERMALYSHYGPVIQEPDTVKGIAYCGASPYLEAVSLFEQQYRMVTARNCRGFYDALAMNQLMEQNITFADTAGNIQYVRNGCTPIRPGACNWSAPVPGGTDATRWKGFHPIQDLVQVLNPPQGYFQNCNVSPEVMMKGSPMTRDKYPDYVYNVTWDTQTPRGSRMLELLDADSSITREEAMEFTLNVYDILAKPWQEALKAALDAAGKNRAADPAFDRAVADILAWDGGFTRDSTAATVIRYWRLKCDGTVSVLDIANRKPLEPEDQAKMLDCLASALDEMKAKYGRLEVPWGDVNRIGRGGKDFACPGAEFGGGDQRTYTETVMDVGGVEEPAGSGRFIATNGSSSVLLSFLRPDGIESYSVVNWGQSGDPGSPHYVDQAEKLYAERKFKPTWFRKDELLQHLESEKALNVN